MGYELSVDPPKCRLTGCGGTTKHKIVNHCDQMLAYKIVMPATCQKYSVDNLYGLIQIGYTVDINVTRAKGPTKTDQLVIQYASVPQTCVDPKAPFATGKPVGEITGETIFKLTACDQ